MKKLFFAVSAAALFLASCEQEPDLPFDVETLEFTTDDEEMSYCLGVSTGFGIQKDSVENLNIDELVAGIEDMYNADQSMQFKYTEIELKQCYDQHRNKTEAARKLFNDTLSYAIGLNLGNQYKNQMGLLDFDDELFHFGMTSVFNDYKLMYRQGETDTVITEILMKKRDAFMQEQQKAYQEQQQRMMEMAKEAEVNFADNKKAGEDFLTKNKSKKGIIVTDSGLQIEVIKKGSGPNVVSGQIVKIHYSGTLINGDKFDSSYDRGEPYQTASDKNLIQGWIEAIPYMQAGGKYKIYVPQELGYGFQDKGSIPPFSTLIFEMELVEIVQ